ncbi:diguanylate cyclase domain-containing protein [Seleniivibrio woodruffii]|uniref:two-component system response regulator n=1 Tax=Seleniivibrio woodruffii TaxID=1078050 RepID=UPI0026F25787|nr:diguanylate cyclase [Seleniivibrio woodruffii]
MKILILDDDVNILASMKRNLRRFDISLFSNPHEAIAALDSGTFAVALSDMQMPGLNGVDFLEHVKTVSPQTIRIMLTGYANLNNTMDAINKASVHRFLTKPFDINNLACVLEDALELYRQTSEQQTRTQEYLHQSMHDALTGLPNRTMLADRIEVAMHRCTRELTICALLFIDLNKFKPINDTFGHKVGDEVLCEVAHRLKNGLRSADTVARIGGDEFVILLQDIKEPQDAAALAEKLLRNMEKPIISSTGIECSVGASIGVTLFSNADVPAEAVIERADRLMYEAKKDGGKSRVITDL